MIKSYLIPASCTLALFAAVANWVPAKENVISPRDSVPRTADPYANRDGKAEAMRMLQEGQLGIVGFGMPVPWSSEYREILRTEYQIDYRAIAGCIVSHGIVDYARDFNGVMDPIIEERFGSEVFTDALNTARIRYQDRITTEEAMSQISVATTTPE